MGLGAGKPGKNLQGGDHTVEGKKETNLPRREGHDLVIS